MCRVWAELRVAASLSSCVLACIGCSHQANVQSDRSKETLSIGTAAPEGSLDPGIASVAGLLRYETVLTTGSDGRAGASIVATWERSADGLVWKFRVREGVTFHDGTPLTAEHVAETLRKALSNPNAVASAPSFQQVSSVTAETPTQFSVKLSAPSALLLSDLAYVDVLRGTGDDAPGTGPFVVEAKEQKRIVMRRFDRYREGAPAIARIELNAFPTVRNAWSAMMRGEVDVLYEVGADAADFVGGESSVQTFTLLRPYTLTLGFNLHHPVLQSREVRRALNRAIDRNAIVRAGFRGRARPAQDPVWPSHWALSNTLPAYTYDREAAVRGLTSAGYGTLRQSRGRMPSRFQFTCLVHPPLERVALMIQKQLFEIGVDMEIEVAKTAEIVQRAARGNFDAFLIWQLTGRSLTFPYLFWHSPEPGRPGFLQSGYSAADSALDRVRYAPNDDAFRGAVAAFQQVIHDDPPAVFLAWEERVRAVNRAFHVPPQEPGRDVIYGLWRWRPAEQRSARAE
jgi:peptide/nickel transport system substrate-binding protein